MRPGEFWIHVGEDWLKDKVTKRWGHDPARLSSPHRRRVRSRGRHANRLAASGVDTKHSAKRVYAALLRGDASREQLALESAALDTLARRGEQSGLESYLDEILGRLTPLFL